MYSSVIISSFTVLNFVLISSKLIVLHPVSSVIPSIKLYNIIVDFMAA